jgi:AcrR family transcriptional regulator
MSAVASAAGVATGTAYVYYASKEDLLLAAYSEAKAELGRVAIARVDPLAPPAERFAQLWKAVYRHLVRRPGTARFLVQVEASPHAAPAHGSAAAGSATDPIVAESMRADMAALLAPLPLEVLYELGLAPAVRLAASGLRLRHAQVDLAAHACWRALTARRDER